MCRSGGELTMHTPQAMHKVDASTLSPRPCPATKEFDMNEASIHDDGVVALREGTASPSPTQTVITQSESDEAPDAFVLMARAVTPEKEVADAAVEARLRARAFALKRDSFVQACRLVSERRGRLGQSYADVEYYERKLARRAAAHAEALAEAEAQCDSLSSECQTLEEMVDELSAQIRAKDGELKRLRNEQGRRLEAMRLTLERQLDNRLKSELAKRDSQVASQLAQNARLRESDSARYAEQVTALKNAHEVDLAKQGVAYAALSRKYEEVKSTLARLAQACQGARPARQAPSRIPATLLVRNSQQLAISHQPPHHFERAVV